MKSKQCAVKKNLSSIQVLKTLQVLIQGDYTMAEIVEKLNEKEPRPIFNNSVVSKYINTCRHCGIEILKFNNRYYVTKIPFGLDITDNDLDLIKEIQITANEKMSVRSNKHLKKFLDKLNKFSNKNLVRVEPSTQNLTIETFEKAIKEENKVKLILKLKQEFECIPLEIVEHNGKTFFSVYFDNQEQLIAIDRISALQVLKEKFKKINIDKTVIFKLTGALAKNYQLRENENIINDRRPNYIVIANRGDNKEILLSRLLRYQSFCELENPKCYRDEIKNIINKTLSNYGE